MAPDDLEEEPQNTAGMEYTFSSKKRCHLSHNLANSIQYSTANRIPAVQRFLTPNGEM